MSKKGNRKLQEAIKRAERGGYNEYWLQLYIKKNYEKLGFSSIEGPFETGPDFKGTYKGKRVIIEAERLPTNFIKHGHNLEKIDILVILGDDDTDRSRLPKKIIKVDPEDFIKSTHEMRKNYAIEKQNERKFWMQMLPFFEIKHALSILWSILVEEVPLQGTPEAEAFEKALDITATFYIGHYYGEMKIEGKEIEVDIREKMPRISKIGLLANQLIKSYREFHNLTADEKHFIELWVGFLKREYTTQI